MMIARIAIAACLIAGSIAGGSALAEERDERAPARIYRSKTIIEFGTVEVQGAIVRPSGSYIEVRGRTRFRPLLRIRGDFRPELEASIQNL